MGPSLGSGGRGRGQAVTLRGLWREGGGGRARRVGGLARGAAGCSGSAVGWGSGRWLGRWQASHRNGVPDGGQTRSEQRGPTVPPQRPKSPLTRTRCPVSGVPLLGAQGGMVGGGWQRGCLGFHEDQRELPSDRAHPVLGAHPQRTNLGEV